MIRNSIATIFLAVFLSACGGSHSPWSASSSNTVPTAPTNLAGYAGNSAVTIGWEAPTTGSTPFSYNITITPTEAGAVITRDGTHAIILGLTNDTSYTFSVTAKNSAGESTAATVLLQPTAVEDFNSMAPLTSAPNSPSDSNNQNGISDASVLTALNKLWIAYSSVNYYQESGNPAQDTSTSLASSSDGGATFSFIRTIGQAQKNVNVTTNSTANPCGNPTCIGHWVYGTPFLVNDASDPDSNKRFKLFAHKYFLYPPASSLSQSANSISQSAIYALGAIVMWTAPSPSSSWSAEKVVLGWNSTPKELVTTNNINTLDTALSTCIYLNEGSAATYQGNLDFVFACNDGTVQKIVMLRSSDHASTFKYVSTPLEAVDAVSFSDALYFSAPALVPTESNAPILIVTPVINRPIDINGVSTTSNAYSGCIAFSFADEATGRLFRNSSAPISILQIDNQDGHLNGACAWDVGTTAGILMNDSDSITSTPQFNILSTGKSFF